MHVHFQSKISACSNICNVFVFVSLRTILPCLVILLLMHHEPCRACDVRAVHHKECTEILSLGYRIINALESLAENKGCIWSVNPKSFSYNLCATTHTAINLTSGSIQVHKTKFSECLISPAFVFLRRAPSIYISKSLMDGSDRL